MPPLHKHVPSFNPNEYLQTAQTGNQVSKRSIILGSANIMLGGKCILHPGAIIRGDLKRNTSTAPAEPGAPASHAPERATVVVLMGRYCLLDEGCIVRPPWKVYRGKFSYYPLKMGDYVSIGANSVVEAATLGSHVEVGANCIIGRFSIIKDSVRILDGSVVAPNTVIPPFSIYAGNPAKWVGDLPESFPENFEAKRKDYYQRFRPATER
ncbi:hypothetical protein ACQY0O_008037 [Thecaphora frezii]